MQVLLFLIQHAGKEVTKAQIFQHVWRDSVVADDILSVSVSKIRKALGDKARAPTFIKTLPGVGYVLIAKVEKREQIEEESISPEVDLVLPRSRTIRLLVVSLAIFSLFVVGLIAFLREANLPDTTLPRTVLPESSLDSNNKTPISDHLSIRSIAVLPFDDLSDTSNNQHFTDGLSDAIINQLAQIKSLKVISRYSSFTYRGDYVPSEVGRALQVETLLDGNVQSEGERTRINVRLISTQNAQQLWSESFDFDNKNLNSFKLQDKITSTIQNKLQVNPSSNPNNTNPNNTNPNNTKPNSNSTPAPISQKVIDAQAYEWYLMGQYHWRQRNPKSLNKAVTYFKHSLELEPDYAEAHVGLSITYAFLHDYANWSEDKALDEAFPHIEKALALKPNSATGLAAKGMLLSNKALYQARLGEPDPSLYQQAQQAFLRSLELENNATTHHWYSSLLKRLGKETEVIQHMNQAIALNPLSASMQRSFSFYLQSLGKQDSAQRMFQNAQRLDPDNFSELIDAAKMFRYSQSSVLATAKWQAENAEQFTICSSIEYCEELVFMYLSIGLNQAADNILNKIWARHTHFRNSLFLINAGQAGNDDLVLARMERLTRQQPNNRKRLLELAIAQFRISQFGQTRDSLWKLFPQWRNSAPLMLKDITADNYSALLLYAAALSQLDEPQQAQIVLSNLRDFLKQGKVLSKTQAEFSLAEVNAQLGDTSQAIAHLKNAFAMGWLTAYNREWWPLQSNHFLRPLSELATFKSVIEQHDQELIQLSNRVSQTLK